MTYWVEFFGDLPRLKPDKAYSQSFYTYDAALKYIKDNFCIPDENYEGVQYFETPDPEDDRILVWKLEPGNDHVVWHFSGWHYYQGGDDPVPESMEQGKLPGFDISLYELSMKEY